MSIFLAEGLDRFTKDMPRTVSLEFFCDNKNDKRNTADSIIQGLVFQLLLKRPELINHVLPTFSIQQASLFSGSSFESLWRIFEKMTCDPILRAIYCVLDGLDECDKGSLEVLLRHLKALFSTNSSDTPSCRLNLIAVSRDLPVIIPELLSGFPRIRLDQDADIEVNQDITRFIDAKLDDIFSVKQYPQITCVKVKKFFRERAQGTFLWIGIAAKMLEGYNATEFETALERLPPGLNELYTRMLLGIKVDHQQIAARILRWVVMSVRPLTLLELSAIIEPTVEPPAGFTREDVTKDQVSYCGYFLMTKGSEVGLIHQSAKDYLLRGDRGSNPELKDFRMDEKAGNHEIARKCFQYLEDNLLASGDTAPRRKTSLLLEAFPLLSYATRYWHIHARSLPSSDDIFDLSRPFYRKDSRIRELWLKTYRKLTRPIDNFPNSAKPLHIASHFDILPLAEKLLTQGGSMNKVKRFRSVNEKDSTGMTALHWTVEGGHLAIARLLLKKGADINARDHFDETALHRAADSGYEEFVRLLLEKGADINAKDVVGETALHRAAGSGYEGLVRLLLDMGVDINAKDDDGETALHYAAIIGYEGLARLLVEKGADINAKNSFNKTALHLAAHKGHEGLVRLLLDMGADINAKNSIDQTALPMAASIGHEGLVRLLLEKGADIDARDRSDETALHKAADSGHEGLVRLLLEKRADINAKDDIGETALHWAAGSGNEGLVRLLLDMGADINARDLSNATALHEAADSGHEGLVELLLDRGVDFNAKDDFGNTALDVASSCDPPNEVIIQLLRRRDSIRN